MHLVLTSFSHLLLCNNHLERQSRSPNYILFLLILRVRSSRVHATQCGVGWVITQLCLAGCQAGLEGLGRFYSCLALWCGSTWPLFLWCFIVSGPAWASSQLGNEIPQQGEREADSSLCPELGSPKIALLQHISLPRFIDATKSQSSTLEMGREGSWSCAWRWPHVCLPKTHVDRWRLRRLGHESSVLMEEIGSKLDTSCFHPPSQFPPWWHSRKTFARCWYLDPGLPSLQNWESVHLPSLMYSVIVTQNGLRYIPILFSDLVFYFTSV
jgi:hypothetical protein